MEIAEPEGTQRKEAETATTEPMPDVERAFEEIEVDAPLVGIIMGSKNDKPKMQPAGQALQEIGIRYEVRVMSAHRDPEKVREYCHAARMRGLRVLIAGAGMSAALPGVAAAHTDLPVIGVPLSGKNLGGLDALLSAVQMPPGVPVGSVAIDGAKFWRMFFISSPEDRAQSVDALLGDSDRSEFGDKRVGNCREHGPGTRGGVPRIWVYVGWRLVGAGPGPDALSVLFWVLKAITTKDTKAHKGESRGV